MLDSLAPNGAPVFVALADPPASKKLHYQLRYQVYCQKLAYEDPTQFPDGEERDQYDEHAVHFLAYDGRRGDWAGALRLVCYLSATDKVVGVEDIEKRLTA